MAINLYDDAFMKKLNKWISDPQMVMLKPNETNRLFQIKADQNNDKPLKLPLIAVSRDPQVTLDVLGRRSLSCDGVKLDGSEEVTLKLNAIPINLTYQIDIYTRRYEEGNEYLRSLVFNIVNHPKMKVLIPYNGAEIEHVCNLWIQPELTDNSDIAEKLFADEFTRWTIRVEVHDAFFFSVPLIENRKIIGVELEVKNNRKDTDSLTVEYDAEQGNDYWKINNEEEEEY